MKMKHRILLFPAALMLFLLFTAGLTSCEFGSIAIGIPRTTPPANTVFQPLDEPPVSGPQTNDEDSLQTTVTTKAETPPVTEAPKAQVFYHPLSALPVGKAVAEKRPIALSLDGSGLSALSAPHFLLEGPVESGKTRYLYLTCDDPSEFRRDEILSTRPYFAALAHDFYAISAYRGTSDDGRESTAFLYDTLDFSRPEIADVSLSVALKNTGFPKKITGGIALPYSFVAPGEMTEPGGTYSSYIRIPFFGGSSTAFTYDSLSHVYTLRAGANDRPAFTFTNVFVLFFNTGITTTKTGVTLSMDTDAGGTGYYISNGYAVPIEWERDTSTSALRFYAEGGRELKINRGKTYIAMTDFSQKTSLILN